MTLARRITGLSRGPGAFSPADVSGLLSWYDFSAASTLFTDTSRTTPVASDGDVIKGVTDRSGNGYHLSEATNGPQYKVGIINSLSVGRWDSSNDILISADFSLTQPFTYFVVGNCQGGAGTTRGFVDGKSSGRCTFYRNGASDKWGMYASGGEVVGPSADTSNHIFQCKFHGASSALRVDGGANTLSAGPGSDNPTGVHLGAFSTSGSNLGGDIGEAVFYSGALSLGDLDLVGDYLQTRWGLTWTAAS